MESIVPRQIIFIRVSVDSELSDLERWIIRSYRLIKRFSLSAVEDFGLETANVQEELIPIYVGTKKEVLLTRSKRVERAAEVKFVYSLQVSS
ncbi:MAG: hypothetical protein IPO25_23165 [Saprospiraceae bacterium]|nr:hypothetical protein [Saprospiraceae bacterium]